MNYDYGWECSSCGAWGRGTDMEHFADCDLLLMRQWIGDIATILITNAATFGEEV